MRRLFRIPVILILCMPVRSTAEDVAYWQNVSWPPFQILRGPDADRGRFDVIIRLFQDRPPQYEPRNVEMNWSRYWEDVKSGKPVLNSMAIKTVERSEYALFSHVMTFTLPHRKRAARAP